jgi:hypothetical protein
MRTRDSHSDETIRCKWPLDFRDVLDLVLHMPEGDHMLVVIVAQRQGCSTAGVA